ncbi:MAG: TonB-dependent receptor plug domain-containing protein [Desulfuromonadaceae bacterium]|nr:TonB-dependent receptor plug domain-containing protein [Desulfuromonadaceae bacterium]
MKLFSLLDVDKRLLRQQGQGLMMSLCLLLLLWTVFPVEVQATDSVSETLLMFVGEEDEVVTAASRAPEAPTIASAVVDVIERDQIERAGYRTLAELLADQPGFFMASGGRGTIPYLRGLRNAILFLYDGVPITTDVSKSFAPLDGEISLSAVERVEIVRGAGSVLWGADAFAGVVNIVPRRSRLGEENRAKFVIGGQDIVKEEVSWEKVSPGWDFFLNLSNARDRLHEQHLAASEGQQQGSQRASRYGEIVANFNLANWLQVSGRWSDYRRRYQMRNASDTILWSGSKEAPFNYLKVSTNTTRGSSHYKLTGFLQQSDYQIEDAGIERQQSNRLAQLELLWDRRVLSRGLFSLGTSWRENRVTGALVRDVYLPGFLAPEENFFSPSIASENFSNRLWSVYSQFRYRVGLGEWWAGLRLDDHSQYREALTWSLGFYCPLAQMYSLKVVYGSAFRSPYSSQLYDNRNFEPERIETLSLQLSWQGETGHSAQMTFYYSHLADHIEESPFGLSLPAEREVYGMEGSAQIALPYGLKLLGGLSLVHDDGGHDDYRVLVATYLRPDGTRRDIYDQWSDPVNQGPGWLAHVGLEWLPWVGQSLSIHARWGGGYSFSYDKGAVEENYRYPLLIDLCYRRPGILHGRDALTLRVTNLTDRDYHQPDLYGSVEGEPLKLTLSWEFRF